jgi:hypothetical protein
MSSKEKDGDNGEKDLLREMLEVVDGHLEDIQGKLENMEVLLFIIALPIIISFILLIVILLTGSTHPSPF